MSAPNLGLSHPVQVSNSRKDKNFPIHFGQEMFWLILVLIAGLLPRIVFIQAFPTRPVSDFLSLLNFSIAFQVDWPAKAAWQWHFFSPGLPLILSLFLRLISQSPEAIGRWATAICTGLVPVIPYILWKDTFQLRTRILAAVMLALWPGQIVFSSVLAQDNWIILPVITLSVLAVRILVMRQDGKPIIAALLYALTVAIREDMLLVLLPIVIPVTLGGKAGRRLRNFLIGSSMVGLLFVGLIFLRGIATGRYTLLSSHLGNSILGAYVPGAGMGWVDPNPYLQAVHPELVINAVSRSELDRIMLRLAWQEFVHRPVFHIIRIVGSTFTNLFGIDIGVIWWSLTNDDVLPKEYQKSVEAFTNGIAPLLQIYPFLVHILLAFSVYFAISQRPLLKWISPMLLSIILKVGLHAIVVPQPRFFLVVIGLELLTFAVISEVCFKLETRPVFIRSLVLGILSVFAVYQLSIKARDYVWTHDVLSQLNYHFSLHMEAEQVECRMNQGPLIFNSKNEAGFEILNSEPYYHESAITLCIINPKLVNGLFRVEMVEHQQ